MELYPRSRSPPGAARLLTGIALATPVTEPDILPPGSVRSPERIGLAKRPQGPAGSLLAVMIAALTLPVAVPAAAPDPPDWADDPDCVRHLYVFPDNNMEPAPDESDNSFGESGAVVGLDPSASGWRDPDPTLDPPQKAGDPDHGAWDLGYGPEGAIRVTVPVRNIAAGEGAAGYAVDLQVNAVGYVLGGIRDLPLLKAVGYSLTNVTVSDSPAFDDPGMGEWKNRTWTARIEDVMEDEVTLIIEADPNWGSLIDTIEAYALAADHAVWAGDGKSPVWWADLVGRMNGAALTVHEGYLINQHDLARPFQIIDFGFDETGHPVASWESSGPARGIIQARVGKHLADKESWISVEGVIVHDNGLNTWRGTDIGGKTNLFVQFRIVPE